MPNIQRNARSLQKGVHTKTQISTLQPQSLARDDLDNAFAGKENEGPHKDSRDTNQHSTNVKSRKTKKSKSRTPIR